MNGPLKKCAAFLGHGQTDPAGPVCCPFSFAPKWCQENWGTSDSSQQVTVAILLRSPVSREEARVTQVGAGSHMAPWDDKLKQDFMAECDGNHNT